MQGLTVGLTGLEVIFYFFKCPAKILFTYLLYVHDLCVCVLSTGMSTTWVPGIYGGQQAPDPPVCASSVLESQGHSPQAQKFLKWGLGIKISSLRILPTKLPLSSSVDIILKVD